MVNRRQRRAHNLPEVTNSWWTLLCFIIVNCFFSFTLSFAVSSQDYLYGQATKSLSYNDFVNKELVLFSNSDNERSIPCLVDGARNDDDHQEHICNS